MARLALALAIVFLSTGAQAFAFEWSPTFAPIRLVNPILEVDLERRLSDHLSVTGFAAAGKTKVENVEMVSRRVFAWEVGAQVGYYLLGDFDRGMAASLEVVYVSLDTDTDLEPDGPGFGPLIGYKFALKMGFTVLAQAGISYFPGSGPLHNSLGADRLVANLNLNLGWSF